MQKTTNSDAEYIIVDETIKYQVEDHAFMQKADDIVKHLLLTSKNDSFKALKKLDIYIKQAGDDLKNNAELIKAKDKLKKIIKH